jgi:dimethylamine--corrinoid protein Co-methyltransferase
MPNLGAYYMPDGPFPNPSDLMPLGKVKEGLEAQEKTVEQGINDMIYIAEALSDIGCDGINFDTVGAAGDGDFKATLVAVEHVKKNTNLSVEVGMASEFVLGTHGELEYDGERLAGMYPHKQVKVAERAGADIFGPVINTKLSKSVPWNLARAVTFSKACAEAANIPVHPNVGMGVGGVPMFETPPPDVVCRVSKALVEIGKADGL